SPPGSLRPPRPQTRRLSSDREGGRRNSLAAALPGDHLRAAGAGRPGARARGAMTRRWGWLLALVAVAALLQLLSPATFDADTDYHFAVARMIRAHGLLHAFPWTPFSWL